jgi:hypothetical protein
MRPVRCQKDGRVYRTTDGVPLFQGVRAPTQEQLQALLTRSIKRLMRLLTPRGYLIEEQAMTYLADTDRDAAFGPLQAAACTYRIALGPRAGRFLAKGLARWS